MTISHWAALAAVVLFPTAMVFAGLLDVMTMKIRNQLVAALLLGYAVLAPLAGMGLGDMGSSIALAALVWAIGFTMFSLGWIGGGDAKLAAASVLWLGTGQALAYVLYTAVIGAGLALAILAFRRMSPPPAGRLPEWIERLRSAEAGVPYGAAMAPAALLVFPDTAWMTSLL